MRLSLDALDRRLALPPVRHVGNERPFRWLQLGWQDLRRAPLASLAYGLLFAICGDVLLLLARPYPHLFMSAVSGFFLVAPLLAAGLYEISRRLDRGETITFIDSLACWRRKGPALARLGGLLAIVALLWERLSALVFALIFGGEVMDLPQFLAEVVASSAHTPFVAAWFILGASLALLVFAATAVSVPMLLEREVGVADAIATSLRAVLTNLDAMFLWAMIIVTLTLLGFASLLFGLVVVMPVIGHATWHAYRDLLGELVE